MPWRWWISDCLSFVKTRSTHLLIFTLVSSKTQSYSFYICCTLLVWWTRFPVDPLLWYLFHPKIFLPVPLHQNLLSMPAYQVHENRELTIIEWCQLLNPNGSRTSLYKKPFNNDKRIKSNLIFQRFWALSIVLATSTCLANGTLVSTVPQGDLLIIMGIRSFPQNIHNCTSDMHIMTTTSSLSTARQIEHRLSHKMTLTNKNIKQ